MAGDHPQKIGKYDVIEPLGEGGMGVVYKARDPLIDRIVAIKTIRGGSDFSDDNLVARLTQEAKAAGRLHHPNIVTVYDFGQQGDLTYLAMEFIEGTNLARLIAKGRQISLATKVDIIIQICQGLAYAHEIGVVHRDIKPANICLTSNGTPKILDFGLARFDETRLTKTGFTSGTVQYMSPERMRGNSGPHDDIFAVGAVAYEILTHEPAFPGKTYKEVVTKIMSPNYPVPPSQVADLPKGFDPIILKAMNRDLMQRYKTAAEMARDLEKLRNSKEFLAIVSGENLKNTAEQPIDVFDQTGSGSHPYSAGEIERRKSGEVASEEPPTDRYATAKPAEEGPATVVTAQQAIAPNAPTMVTAIRPVDEPAPETEKYDKVHFDKTETELPPVRRDQPSSQQQADRTEVASGRDIAKMPRPAAPYAPPSTPRDDEPAARTKVADRPKSAPPPSQRPPEVTPVAEPTELDLAVLAEQKAAAAEPAAIAGLLAKPFIPMLAGLFVATFAATFVAKPFGTFAFLVVYAIAAVIWTFVVRSAPRITLDRIIVIAIALRLLCFFAAPALSNDVHRLQWDGLVASADMNPWELAPSAPELEPLRNETYAKLDDPDTPSNRAPLTALFSLVWSWTGSSLPVWRLALLAFDVLVVWLLWTPKAPRRSLAWATLPFVALEGVWGGHVELIGAALLTAAFVLGTRQKPVSSGSMLGLAAGTSLFPVATLPALTQAVNSRLRTLAGFLALVLVPYLFVGFGPALFDPLSRAVAQSPTLSLAQRELASVIERTDFAPKFAAGWKDFSPRIGMERYDEWVAKHLDGPALAGIGIALAVLVLLAIVAKRSKSNETAFANSIGLALVVSFAVDPWYWLLVVPFALMSNKPLWVLFALFSPALYLAAARSGEVNWLVYGIAYVMPLLALLGTKLSNKEEGKSAFDYR